MMGSPTLKRCAAQNATELVPNQDRPSPSSFLIFASVFTSTFNKLYWFYCDCGGSQIHCRQSASNLFTTGLGHFSFTYALSCWQESQPCWMLSQQVYSIPGFLCIFVHPDCKEFRILIVDHITKISGKAASFGIRSYDDQVFVEFQHSFQPWLL